MKKNSKIAYQSEGTILSIDKDRNGKVSKFTVRFVLDGDKKFNYPDAFSKGLKWVRGK